VPVQPMYLKESYGDIENDLFLRRANRTIGFPAPFQKVIPVL
jgi:hypothetical protein